MADKNEKHYGYLMTHWQEAKQEMRLILIDMAQQGQTITYGELSARITTIHLPPYSYAMSGMLREVCAEDDPAEAGMLATLVVRKSDGRPGPGYFKGMVGRHLEDDDIEAFWQAEFEKVCRFWQGYSSSGGS